MATQGNVCLDRSNLPLSSASKKVAGIGEEVMQFTKETFGSVRAAFSRTQGLPLLSLMLTQAAVVCWVFSVWLVGEHAGLTRSFFLRDGAYASVLGWVVMGAVLLWGARRLDRIAKEQADREWMEALAEFGARSTHLEPVRKPLVDPRW